MRDTLTAECTVCLADRAVAGDIDCGAGTGSLEIPDVKALNLVADLDTAHALDALFRIADQRECLIPRLFLKTLSKTAFLNVQIVCNLLERAVSASHTGGTLAVVLGEDHLNCQTAVKAYLRAVGVDDHALCNFGITRSQQAFLSLDLHYTDTAGTDVV